MRPEDLQRHKEQLLELRTRTREDLEELIDAVEEERPQGEHDWIPSQTNELDASLEASKEQIHTAVIEALERIDNGAYGRCADCGREISEERLDAIPYTEVCVRCELRREKTGTA